MFLSVTLFPKFCHLGPVWYTFSSIDISFLCLIISTIFSVFDIDTGWAHHTNSSKLGFSLLSELGSYFYFTNFAREKHGRRNQNKSENFWEKQKKVPYGNKFLMFCTFYLLYMLCIIFLLRFLLFDDKLFISFHEKAKYIFFFFHYFTWNKYLFYWKYINNTTYIFSKKMFIKA